MATVLPPPGKRQKREIAEKARQQQKIQGIPDGLGSIRVQFIDQATGKSTGPAVAIPVADATVKNLETLLNTLQGNVGMHFSPLPLQFYRDASSLISLYLYRMILNAYHIDLHFTQKARIIMLSMCCRIYFIHY
jgi:hypothetical protein